MLRVWAMVSPSVDKERQWRRGSQRLRQILFNMGDCLSSRTGLLGRTFAMTCHQLPQFPYPFCLRLDFHGCPIVIALGLRNEAPVDICSVAATIFYRRGCAEIVRNGIRSLGSPVLIQSEATQKVITFVRISHHQVGKPRRTAYPSCCQTAPDSTGLLHSNSCSQRIS